MPGKPRGRGWKRVPPPDATGKGTEYLRGLTGGNIVARMTDGSELQGRVADVGTKTLEIACTDGPRVLVRISEIRTIQEGE